MRTETADYATPGFGSRIRSGVGAIFSDRARLRKVLMYGGVGIVAVVSAYLYFTGGRYVTTDDAYVHAAKLMVSTDVSGLVQDVDVHEGQVVKKGDVLFRLDQRPFTIALDNAKAALAQAVQNVEGTKAQYRSFVGQIASQQATVNLNQITYGRYQALARQNAIAGTTLDQARGALQSAQATLISLQQQARQTLAQLNGNPDLPDTQAPAYLSAAGAVAEAQRQLDHTIVRAPFEGVVGEVDSLQPGTLVISAMSAFTTTSAVGLVSSKDVWVAANMKETDLTYVRNGDPVDITVDTYPSCSWTGQVGAVAAASDSAFSPLPAENGSGNWVKVVQRIATRIKIIGSTCPNVTLSDGMSASVSIDTGKRRWNRMMGG
jgi:membrane fusion protein (multidrug efflux system)